MSIIFGAGFWAKKLIHYENELRIQFFIDNDKKKAGTLFWGYEVKAPEAVLSEPYDFIILSSEKHGSAMEKQLLEMGVREEKIVSAQTLAYFDNEKQKIAAQEEPPVPLMDIKIRTKQDYEQLQFDSSLLEIETVISRMVLNSPRKRIAYPGMCQVCKRKVNLLLDNQYAESSEKVNLRERLVCPFCDLNNRQREMARMVLKEVPLDRMVYVTEQVTPMYQCLKKYYYNLIGSEYLGVDFVGGTINEKGIRHEDLMNLSFGKETFDCVISNDVFEHVAEIEKALKEIYRVLKEKGILYATLPFFYDRNTTVKRAKINENGSIEYLLEPVYHGNPLSDEGSLVFYDYGYDFLSLIREVGFSDTYLVPFYSVPYGNIGIRSLFILIAKK